MYAPSPSVKGERVPLFMMGAKKLRALGQADYWGLQDSWLTEPSWSSAFYDPFAGDISYSGAPGGFDTSLEVPGTGMTVGDLYGYGYTPGDISAMLNSDPFGSGYSASDLYAAGWNSQDIQNFWDTYAGVLTNASYPGPYTPNYEVPGTGQTVNDLLSRGYTPSDIALMLSSPSSGGGFWDSLARGLKSLTGGKLTATT